MKAESPLADELRNQCTQIIILMAEAIRCPRIARPTIEQAVKHLADALRAARQLDPEDS